MREKILLAKDTISNKDIDELVDWLSTYPRLTKGGMTIAYEEKYSESIGRKYSVFVNSGSSAILIALYSLIVTDRLKNKKVIIPALSWITTVSPAIQFNLEPILCDINLNDLSVNIKELELLFKEEQPAVFILVTVLGLVPDMDRIINLCETYDVILLIDNCESQFSEYKGKSIESYGCMSMSSSYFGHNSSTVEGGIITTDDSELYNVLKMLRSHGWDRDLDEAEKQRLQTKYNISGFNSLYTFYHVGFNLRSTDLSAFIGLGQLKKKEWIKENRNRNYLLYNKHLKNGWWKPNVHQDGFVCNLGYPIIHSMRDKIVEALESGNVEVRPLISGSMGTQPFWVEKYGRQELQKVSFVDKYGAYLPNHPLLSEQDIIYICDIVNGVIAFNEDFSVNSGNWLI